MADALNKPIIVQSDKTVLLEANNPLYEAARDQLARFAEALNTSIHIASLHYLCGMRQLLA